MSCCLQNSRFYLHGLIGVMACACSISCAQQQSESTSNTNDSKAHHKHLGLDHVYLGYWIKGCAKMSYKARFQPIEAKTPKGWVRFDAT